MGLDRECFQGSGRYPGERVAQSLACIETQVPQNHAKLMADLTATVAVTTLAEGQRRETDWGGLVDGRLQTEQGTGRHPVLCVVHEPLPRYSLARWAVGMVAVGAIPGPVRCDFELRSTLYIKLPSRKHVGHHGKPTNRARARGCVRLSRRLADGTRIVGRATSTAAG